ncbi:GNAT family N-acetyltransferase [Sungkyunkwania multivorans]|uniref:GNAT family N-acetyltransferase n=1 Tax=Sungkyunkwania multivorans TaxID=1173618 RepID=A0ABW3D1J4_9FLAO
MLKNEITYKQASSDDELRQILALQQENHRDDLSIEIQKKEGFITLRHDFETLKQMNDACGHIIAKDGFKVVGYALSMTRYFRDDIPLLIPMFQKIEKALPSTDYLVMGQVCIDRQYRGKGIFRDLYKYMRAALSKDFEMLITEVNKKNTRSLNAHKAIGFEILSTSDDWLVIAWDWK